MIDVHVPPQHSCARHRFDRGRDALDRFDLAAFAEVWYTLNQAIFDF
jgi:hypothetical protein